MVLLFRDKKGFTFIEVVAVLIIMGILGAVAATRMSNNEFDLVAQIESIKSHVRYAQIRAMGSDTNTGSNATWGIRTNDGGTSYWLYDQDGNPATLPGAGGTIITLASIGLNSMTPFNLSFNDWGEPFNNGTALAADLPITVTDGSDNKQFTITAVTGFIP